ncbi:MAG: cell division membrane protein, cell division protein FtsW [Candidatus Moranbacteria bacterium GW2011_GWC1_45_18]|nr:MAG: Stage V sporulation protein E [Candidatus Moranbacteria bacterium GW2011_GWC2_40_12]KKT32750.1 MAG: Stage V sporulation protein E [Candidatus Moranbacteria bacterium GW2011_GWF2_44_10]KKT99138.1 MAG: cell division membrane protein, cell division protein FtsW [Candidatus Moranbacteria bacterium GW2011_GWC1_45_18]OGI24725.1 MAG: cell division protein FtsW [Candidatus Moranbacteria bacterium RIFOXYA1_FULL_44_8]OGI40621.1 MAG: cell division protein FtsW [Candidatus Moranbacteria bacterium R
MKSTNKPDQILTITTFALIVFGLVMISSAGVALSQHRFNDGYYFFKHQLFYGVLPGLFMMYIAQKIDYHFWRRIAFLLFAANLILLILVFIPGVGLRFQGASRWITLGPFSFQPTEMLKLTMILYLAAWLESKKDLKRDLFEGFFPFLAILGIVGFLIIKQPDMGTLGTIVVISVIIFFLSGAKTAHIASMAGMGILAFFALVKFESYRMNRLLVFLHPELDPRGIGYQINQALLAIGSGGLFGLGLGHSRQKFNYLPEPVGDSIFAIICEEIGLIGAAMLILLFVVFAMRGLKIAKKAPDMFGKLIAIGITSWIIFQALINISAITGLIPLTGVTLPFISYGGTSIIFSMVGVGILLNISKKCGKI